MSWGSTASAERSATWNDSLEDTGEEWSNTAADMWEGKETADDTDAAIINLNDTLGDSADIRRR